MVWLVPFDGITVPVPLPVDSLLDRWVLLGLALAWAATTLGAREFAPASFHSSVKVAVFGFLAVASVSVMLNQVGLARIDEFDLAVKKIVLLLSFVVFFYVVTATVRASEVRAFITLLIALATITAVGSIIEYRTGANHFFGVASHLPFLEVGPDPADPEFGRAKITGPTHHPLALTAILAMATPLAVVRLSDARTTRRRIVYAIVVGLILAASVATLRKTAIVAPLAGLITLACYRPRHMLRLLPFGIVFFIGMQVLSPGALSGIRYQILGGSELSTEARTSDYAAIEPDLIAHPLFGRGYGTYDPKIYTRSDSPQRHRILDNQYLIILVEVGLVGLLAYLLVALSSIVSLHKVARFGDPARAGPALSIIAATVAYVVSNFLFDTLAFPQAPYLFFFLIALGVVIARSFRSTGSAPAGVP
jgi:hypothetical protein